MRAKFAHQKCQRNVVVGYFRVALVASLIASISASSDNDAFKVFRIQPQSWRDVHALADLHVLSDENEMDFWMEARRPFEFTDVMVSPKALPIFESFLASRSLNYSTSIDDVEEFIESNELEARVDAPDSLIKNFPPQPKSAMQKQNSHNFVIKRRSMNIENISHFDNSELAAFLGARLRDEGAAGAAAAEFEESDKRRPFERVGELRAAYPFGMYTGYASMLRYMRTLEFYYPHIVRVVSIGKTHEGRTIEGVKIGYPISDDTKRVFWIDGNIHAREWASSHTALFIINQLVSGYGKNPEITRYLNYVNFVIVPCANPDGFEYSRSSLKPQIRLWRKNRSPERCVPSVWGGERCCQGVDLNRNFDFHWGETGSSTNPCSNLYAGSDAFSEPETKAIADYLESAEMRGRVDAFLTLHTYAQMWIHPYSHEVQRYPHDYNKIKNLAERATERLRQVYGTRYRVGTGADLLSPASGGSDDWAKDKLRVKYVYLVELRPQLEVSRGFILRHEELIPTAIETFEAIKVVIEGVLEENNLTKPRKDIIIEESVFQTASPISRVSVPTTTVASTVMPSAMAKSKSAAHIPTVSSVASVIFAENEPMMDPRERQIEMIAESDPMDPSAAPEKEPSKNEKPPREFDQPLDGIAVSFVPAHLATSVPHAPSSTYFGRSNAIIMNFNVTQAPQMSGKTTKITLASGSTGSELGSGLSSASTESGLESLSSLRRSGQESRQELGSESKLKVGLSSGSESELGSLLRLSSTLSTPLFSTSSSILLLTKSSSPSSSSSSESSSFSSSLSSLSTTSSQPPTNKIPFPKSQSSTSIVKIHPLLLGSIRIESENESANYLRQKFDTSAFAKTPYNLSVSSRIDFASDDHPMRITATSTETTIVKIESKNWPKVNASEEESIVRSSTTLHATERVTIIDAIRSTPIAMQEHTVATVTEKAGSETTTATDILGRETTTVTPKTPFQMRTFSKMTTISTTPTSNQGRMTTVKEEVVDAENISVGVRKLADWLTTSVLYTATNLPENANHREAALPTTKSPTILYASRFLTRATSSVGGDGDGSVSKKSFGVPIRDTNTFIINNDNSEFGRKIAENNGKIESVTRAIVLAPLFGIAELTTVESPKATNNKETLTQKCSDRKYSCIFWIKANQNACEEQRVFMRANCARSCRFCA